MKAFLQLAILLSLAAHGQKGLYHFQKLKAAEGELSEGKKQGLWMYWTYAGFPLKIENYEKGALHGPRELYRFHSADSSLATLEAMKQDKKLYRLRQQRQKAFRENAKYWSLLLQKGFYELSRKEYYTMGRLDSAELYSDMLLQKQLLYPFRDTSDYLLRTFTRSPRDPANPVIEEYSMVSGRRNGPYRRFSSGSTKTSGTGYYLNDKKDSLWNFYNSKDKVTDIFRYRQDQLHGLKLRYHGTHCIDSVFYVNGLKEGLGKRIRKDFTVKDIKHRDTIVIYGWYRRNKLNGRETHYKHGRLLEIVSYRNGKRFGENSKYFPNGQLQLQSFYKDWKRDSVWSAWDEQQNLLWKKVYSADQLIAEEEYYPGSKQLQRSFVVKGNSSVGIWYSPKGKKQKQIEKNPGGEIHTSWDDKGKMKMERFAVRDEPRPGGGNRDSLPAETPAEELDLADHNEMQIAESQNQTQDLPAAFLGGEQRLEDYLQIFDAGIRTKGGEILRCEVMLSEDGEIINFSLKKAGNSKLNKKRLKEAHNIVLMMPRWQAARKDGVPYTSKTSFSLRLR